MVHQQTARNPSFAVIGGGTGSFTLLSVLKYYVRDITALVNMADDGGSTGVLRDELGVLPPGDIRQCLVALSESSDKMRELFNYRFPEGGTFAGHSFGNLFLSAVQKMTNNFDDAVELASEVLNIEGRVEPITLEDCVLILDQRKGQSIVGQYNIETTSFDGHDAPSLRFQTPAAINPEAREAIAAADVVVIAPGNLYISLAPSLIVEGVGEALRTTKAKIVYVANLVNKPQQTANFSVDDYVSELERFAGGKFIDYVLYNTDEPSPDLLSRYTFENEYPVKMDQLAFDKASYRAVPGHFLSTQHRAHDSNDSLMTRSLIRHDADAVSRALMSIYFS